MANTLGRWARVISLAILLVALPAWAQQPDTAATGDTAQAQSDAPQPLDLTESVARDVLEPLQTGVQTQNLKLVLSAFDAETFPDFSQFRDRMKALLDSNAVLLFRYKILQVTSEGSHASVTCEADLDATPLDEGQVPLRRSTQLRLQLKQTPKGWRIVGLTPGDFLAP